jgi:transposase
LASEGLAWCNQLFQLEKQFASLPPLERYRDRDRLARPAMEDFFAWADSLHIPADLNRRTGKI